MSHRVLLCDDEVHIVRVVEFKLAKAGYQVSCAFDGAQAWEAIQAEPPDLLITDLQMPGIPGFELIRRVRSLEATRQIPILMLTAKGYELRDSEIWKQFPDVELLSKPFSPRAVLELVNERLQGERQPGAAAPVEMSLATSSLTSSPA